ncbi:type VI secretion system tube protein Hcp [Nocardioides flavus (ex Wang et al. 2016)]|uniref:type VI secretion system tube protein Hcp n=1 Tax=Nocardioides flavus (ex Wang et al. 2016) TaxID=2058780 RepID=UPI00174A006B|nr:type VI secretion system tube protein Hcp [Nocardioides flavus (ex Wang et al. 2016)]
MLAVPAIGAVALGLTGAGSASGNDRARPPAPVATSQPVATMTIHPEGGQPFSTPVYSLQNGIGVGVSSSSGGTRTSSQPSVSEMTLTRTTDDISPVLFGYNTRGAILPEVELTGSLPDGTPFAYELRDVIISGLSTSAGGTSFSETLSLNFTKITTTVGDSTAAYDLATNTPS